MSERTVKDLVDRVKRRCAFLNAKNPERVLFEECVEALIDVSMQLAQAKTARRFADTVTIENPSDELRAALSIRRVEESNGEEETTADAPTV